MGHNMITTSGDSIKSASDLAHIVATHFKVPSDGSSDLMKITEYVTVQKGGRTELSTFLRDIFLTYSPDEFIQWIPTIRWKAIFTTNYDNCIQQAYDQASKPVQQYITVTHISELPSFDGLIEVPIIHLHGSLFTESSPNILITQTDFVKYKEKRNSLFGLLKIFMSSSCILYTGYSHNDQNFTAIISDLESEMLPAKPQRAFRIDPSTTEMDSFILEQHNIITIKSTFSDFVSEARQSISYRDIQPISFEMMKSFIPETFQNSFMCNPHATTRFFQAWEYVNSITAPSGIDIKQYLQGNGPDWHIVFNNHYFQRSIEDDIYDVLLNYVTEPRHHVHVCVVLGSAGYGITTLLMSLAKQLIVDKAAEVFFHRAHKELRMGDIIFACERDSDSKHVFFIDNASINLRIVKETIRVAGEKKQNCIIVLGARSNEWHQERPTITGVNFQIQPLDNIEIERLLDFLTQNKALNKLEYLSRDHQVAAIQKNYNRELLVAIREATEGRSFDSIIEDEYYKIDDDFSKKVYALVSCFHQHGALARIDLLAKVLNISLQDFYMYTKDSLLGVIIHESIKDGATEYALRTRHRIIASIIWNRCLSTAEKDSILHSSISGLSLIYRLDKEAFDCFVFSDNMVDSLSSTESKIQFFERACRMAPDSPFVRQHYARMLLRTGNYTSAISIIEQSILMSPNNNQLYHTKGHILYNMALTSESIEVGRKFCGQSEEAYLTALRLNDKDAYCYQGLISLYLGWARKSTEESEKNLYLSKAEEIVEIGLQKARDKESIWISASYIDDYIGDIPNRIKSLEMALKNAPGSAISQYLLAKAYFQNNDFSQAQTALERIVFDHPENYRASIELAKVIIQTKNDIKNAIAVMQQSTLFGYSDCRFISMLGGLLFLDREFSESEKVFSESSRRILSDLNRIYFRPSDFGISTQFHAEVAYVGTTYAHLVIEGYPNVRCGTSKFANVDLKKGMRILCSIGFSARRANAFIEEIIDQK